MALFLGLDCSTQSMTGVVIQSDDANSSFTVLASASCQFDQTLPHYGTSNGVLIHDGHVEVPSLMLVEALDIMLEDLQVALEKTGHSFSEIKAVSGSGQQHTTVFWHHDSLELPTVGLLSAFFKEKNVFFPPNGRSWMDSSTTKYCRQLEEALGGAQRMADLTGSRAYERFTGIQLLSLGEIDQVSRVSIVSSMLTSLFRGEYSPIDQSDASGMNLMDIRSRKWSPEVLGAIEKINGPRKATLTRYLINDPVPSHKSLGGIAPYFTKNYSFSPDCVVIPFSGDNPCTLAGMGLSQPGDIGISLGTSGCVFAVGSSDDIQPSGSEGHVFVNPIDTSTYMAMLCYKNGSLARENVRNRRADSSWETFSRLMEQSPPGNNGYLGFFFLQPEITPVVPAESESQTLSGIYGYDSQGKPVDFSELPPEVEVRAIVEWQCLSMYFYTQKLYRGVMKRLIVGGGASANQTLLDTIANVYNGPVYVEVSRVNTAALGGALRAQHGYNCSLQEADLPFTPAVKWELKAVPNENIHAVYKEILGRFPELEAKSIQSQVERFGA
ncbi:hypothetical protein AC1031_001596 [Aphanomyces cochlioides]|nr:hypothetical protein AC1031_001596 [Aphanomyces cochlioides]